MENKNKITPILFSTAMVDAILAGTKCMTRREVKDRNVSPCGAKMIDLDLGSAIIKGNGKYLKAKNTIADTWHSLYCRYEIGDVLWVRETWRKNETQTGFPYHHYADNTIYRDRDNERWKPSIFMPKEACRLFLKITDIRVERLQDISEEDAVREGVERLKEDGMLSFKSYVAKHATMVYPYVSFKTLWQKINGIESWEANTWVWIIEFERVEMPEGFLK